MKNKLRNTRVFNLPLFFTFNISRVFLRLQNKPNRRDARTPWILWCIFYILFYVTDNKLFNTYFTEFYYLLAIISYDLIIKSLALFLCTCLIAVLWPFATSLEFPLTIIVNYPCYLCLVTFITLINISANTQ